MTSEMPCSYRPTSLGILTLVAIGLLAGCGSGNSPEPRLVPATEKAEASSGTQCFYTAGIVVSKDEEIFAASRTSDVALVEKSIGAGGNVNATDSRKRSPLFSAAYCNRPEVATLLIAKGSDVNAKDFLGMTALHAAVVVGSDDVAKALVLKGADVNLQDATGDTPLHVAAATDQMAVVKLLLEHGANTQVRDKRGVSAASLATDNGHKTVAAAIRKWQDQQRPGPRAEANRSGSAR